MKNHDQGPTDQSSEIWQKYQKKQMRKKIPIQIVAALAGVIALTILLIGVFIVLM